MFAPVCQTSGASHVQPISRLRCSGRSERKRLLPTTLPSACRIVANGSSSPAAAFASALST